MFGRGQRGGYLVDSGLFAPVFMLHFPEWRQGRPTNIIRYHPLTLKVLVTTIDALGHF